jgi:diguanylate cyclase
LLKEFPKIADTSDVNDSSPRVRDVDADRERRIALVDDLTGLANRPALLMEAGRCIDRGGRHKRHTAVLVIGMDKFTLVDDALGRPVGNDILRVIADRLMKASRTHDMVARLEQDRFAILLDMLTDPQEVIVIAGRIEAALREPMTIGEHTLQITSTIGIAVSDGETSAGDLLDQSLAAMFRAKRLGGARWEIYDTTLRAETVGRLRMESELRTAIGTGALRPWFQPIMNLATGEVSAVEAFVRWVHPELGILPPAAFLGVAEETGLLPGLWRVVVEDSVGMVSKLRATHAHLTRLGLVMNLSPRQIGQPGLVEGLVAKLERHGMPAGACTLDIQIDTITNLARNRETLQALRNAGIALALDDVGTAPLPIAQLREFPMDILKLDPSLTAAMTSGSAEAGMVLGLVHVARALNATLIAEGVERMDVLRLVESAGVSHAQGHLICPALPVNELIPLLLNQQSLTDRLRGKS